MDRFQALQLFARVIERGTISAAGRSLGLSKTAASKRLQDLEADLNIRLLNRTTRHVSATEAGQSLYERVVPMIRDMESVLEQISESADRPSGVLRILARRSFGMLHIMPALPSFRALYPEVSIDLRLTETVEIAPSHGVDIAIRLGCPEEKSLEAEQLTTDRRVLCASPDYFDRCPPPKDRHDLDRHDCLTYGQDAEPAIWVFIEDAARFDMRVTGAIRSNSGEVLRRAALDGLGLAVLPEWMVAGDVAAGRLQTCLTDHRVFPAGYSAEIYAVYMRDVLRPMKVNAFIQHLQKQLVMHAGI